MKKWKGLPLSAVLFFALCLPGYALDATELVPVGAAVGIRLETDGVLVVGLAEVQTESGTVSPAAAAGVQPGDVLLSLNGRTTANAAEFLTAASALDGGAAELRLRRDGEETVLSVTPTRNAEGAWQLGLWLRDGVSGIGTVTFYDPVSGTFGALGHGVNDLDTGALLPFDEGEISGAEVVDVVRGLEGKPGELCGRFAEGQQLGTLYKNSPSGVFGNGEGFSGEPIPVGSEEETELGPALIRCCVEGSEVKDYAVDICRIYRSPEDHRFLMLKVTDPALLERTGGIVQGMSGSPILQNGKLIGAVTHVLLSDATRGYGISISDMLAAA